jgi:hypothetical protein
MSTSVHRESAKIYQFPRSNAAATGARRDVVAAVDPRWQPAIGVECGSGWYHLAALEEAQRDRK